MKFNEKGTVPVVILVAAVGLLGFMIITNTAPFKDSFLGSLYPKAQSEAFETSANTGNKKQEYILVPSTTSTVYLSDNPSDPNNVYRAQVTLKDKSDNIVADQNNMTYTWTSGDNKIVGVIPSAYCAPGVSNPCPMAQAQLTGVASGSASITVMVNRNRKAVAQALFNVVVASAPTPSPTVIPTGVTVNTNNVEVTLDKVNAQYGLIYGSGFTIKSIDASGFSIKYNEPTQGQGFYESSGGMVPGGTASIRSYINSNKAVGTYTGSAIVQYMKNNIWYNGPTVTYKITLTNSAAVAKRVFVTKSTYLGNFGGLTGADAKCQTSANNVSLGGTWKAWLSDSYTSAASRLTHNEGPYKLIDGTVIADNWGDLTDGTLQHSINLTEFNIPLTYPDNPWTNTTRNGSINNNSTDGSTHCQNWTSFSLSDKGGIGYTGGTNYGWTESGYEYCGQGKNLFCFEQ